MTDTVQITSKDHHGEMRYYFTCPQDGPCKLTTRAATNNATQVTCSHCNTEYTAIPVSQ